MRLDVNPLLDSESPSSGGESTWREEFAIVPAQAPAILFFGNCRTWPPNGAGFTGCGKSRFEAGFGSTGTLACAGFAIVVESVVYA